MDSSNGENEFRVVDKTDYPFVPDPAVLGSRIAVDHVSSVFDFIPSTRLWSRRLERRLTFYDGGRTSGPWNWTAGHLIHSGGDVTDSEYHIRTIDGQDYLFVQHKSGDYIRNFRRPIIFVFSRQR